MAIQIQELEAVSGAIGEEKAEPRRFYYRGADFDKSASGNTRFEGVLALIEGRCKQEEMNDDTMHLKL